MSSHRDGDRDRKRACDLADATHTVAVDLGGGAIERDARDLLASLDRE